MLVGIVLPLLCLAAAMTSVADAQAVENATVESLTKLYTDYAGDLYKLAAATGCNARRMRNDEPVDADDFASKVLAGAYYSSAVPKRMPKEMRALRPKEAGTWRRTGPYVRQATGVIWERVPGYILRAGPAAESQ